MQSLSLTIFLPSPNNSHFLGLFPTLRQQRYNFETTWWQLCDFLQSVTLAIFPIFSIPKISGNGWWSLYLWRYFFQRYFSTVFLEWNIHSMERQYELQYSSAIEKNTVFTRLFLHQRYRRHQNDETLLQNLFKNILIGPKTDHCLDLSQTQ